MKALEHPLTLAAATGFSLTSFLAGYNLVMTAGASTIAFALALNKGWKTFGPGIRRFIGRTQ